MPLENTITITQHQTFFDNLTLMFKTFMSFKILRISIILIAAASLLSWILMVLSDGKFHANQLLEVITNVLGMILMWAAISLIGTTIMRMTKPYLFKPITYYFDHWGIRFEGERFSGEVSWRKITRKETTAKAFVLYELSIPSIFIAKKNFKTSEDIAAFEALLESNLET